MTKQRCYSTRSAEGAAMLLGAGGRIEGVNFTHQEVKQLSKFYREKIDKNAGDDAVRTNKERYQKKLDDYKNSRGEYEHHKPSNPPPEPDYESIRRGVQDFENAGSVRTVMRETQRDGARVMGFLSNYLEPGEDPVTLVASGLSELGYEIHGDLYDPLWGNEEEDEP